MKNRILFLPRNRHLWAYAKRAWFRGHSVRFEKVDLNDHWFMEYFDDEERMKRIYWPLFERHYYEWRTYFVRKRTDHVVVDRETNIEINAAVAAAQDFHIATSYVMHGCDIFDVPDRWRLMRYDYLYVPNQMTVDYMKSRFVTGRAEVLKFDRWASRPIPLPQIIDLKPRILFVPMMNHQDEFVEKSGCLLTNLERHNYLIKFWYAFGRLGHKVLWCHNPALDRVYNPMVRVLEENDEPFIKWVKKTPASYFGQVDLVITDVGSTLFFEAIWARKPIFCLYHEQSLSMKEGAKEMFNDSLKSFNDTTSIDTVLHNALSENLIQYLPVDFLLKEAGFPNAKLIWKEQY